MKKTLLVAMSTVLLVTLIPAAQKKHSRTSKKKSSYSAKATQHRSGSSSRGRRSSGSSQAAIARASITGVNVVVRKSPSTTASVLTKVSGGNVAVLGKQGDWYKLRFQYGSIGWVRSDNVKLDVKDAAKTVEIKLDPVPVVNEKGQVIEATRYAMIANRTVNVRRGPSTSNSTITKTHGGKALIMDKWGDWYKIKTPGGTVGWVRKDFLVFPSNFDFKTASAKASAKVAQQPIVVAKKQEPKENYVEVVGSGEKTPIETTPAVENSTPNVPAENNSRVAMVVGDDIAIRRGPSTTNTKIRATDGGRVEILEEHADWFRVRFSGGTVGWVKGDYVSFPGHERKAPEPAYVSSGTGGKVDRMMTIANGWRGTKYVWAGTSRNGTDCSGFTMRVFQAVGVKLPRTAREQATRGSKVTRANLTAGDLVFFNTRGYISHVGIYIGKGKFIHASSGGRRVMESSLNETYYSNRFLFGKRILSPDATKKLDLPNPGEIPSAPPVATPPTENTDNKVEISNGDDK